jgi:MoaA/NifB/PqqE/SkfB family radical SAM enzyme
MCDIPKSPGRQEDELSTEETKKIILQIKDLGVRHLIFSGGEPLLREDLIELVRFARASGIPWVDIITNGILCDDNIVEELIRAGLNHVTVSLDGISGTHDSIRGDGSFQKSTRAIDMFNYHKQRLRVSSPSVGINFTILNRNIGDILKIVEFAKEKKCNAIVFQPVLVSNVTMHERKKNTLWPSAGEIFALEKNILELLSLKSSEQNILIYTDNAILKGIPGYFRGKRAGRGFKCYEALKRIVITCDGKIWSCKGIYGDLKTGSLRQIWLSAQAQNIRKAVNVCKDHCLQDCVYFPMDISGHVKDFLSGIKSDEDRVIAGRRLISRMDYCINRLQGWPMSRSLSCFVRRRREVGRLSALKKETLKECRAGR